MEALGGLLALVMSAASITLIVVLIARAQRSDARALEAQANERARIAEETRLEHQRQVADYEIKLTEYSRKKITYDLARIADRAMGAFERVPRLLVAASERLDAAEQDLADSAFSPFWESIEGALTHLGEFDSRIQDITAASRSYGDLLTQSTEPQAPFPVNVSATEYLDGARRVGERLERLVRRAQTNPHFSMIYEQRRTSAILIAGFRGLSEAIHGMSYRIESSLEGLRDSLEDSSARFERLHADESAAAAERGRAEALRQDEVVRELRRIRGRLQD